MNAFQVRSIVLPIDQLFSLIDFLGVFVGALGGALAAVRDTRYKYDLVGVTGLALASPSVLHGCLIGPDLRFVDWWKLCLPARRR